MEDTTTSSNSFKAVVEMIDNILETLENMSYDSAVYTHRMTLGNATPIEVCGGVTATSGAMREWINLLTDLGEINNYGSLNIDSAPGIMVDPFSYDQWLNRGAAVYRTASKGTPADAVGYGVSTHVTIADNDIGEDVLIPIAWKGTPNLELVFGCGYNPPVILGPTTWAGIGYFVGTDAPVLWRVNGHDDADIANLHSPDGKIVTDVTAMRRIIEENGSAWNESLTIDQNIDMSGATAAFDGKAITTRGHNVASLLFGGFSNHEHVMEFISDQDLTFKALGRRREDDAKILVPLEDLCWNMSWWLLNTIGLPHKLSG
jgi:hypothetical protein